MITNGACGLSELYGMWDVMLLHLVLLARGLQFDKLVGLGSCVGDWSENWGISVLRLSYYTIYTNSDPPPEEKPQLPTKALSGNTALPQQCREVKETLSTICCNQSDLNSQKREGRTKSCSTKQSKARRHIESSNSNHKVSTLKASNTV